MEIRGRGVIALMERIDQAGEEGLFVDAVLRQVSANPADLRPIIGILIRDEIRLNLLRRPHDEAIFRNDPADELRLPAQERAFYERMH